MAPVLESHFVIANGNSWRDLLESDAHGKLPPLPRERLRRSSSRPCWLR